MEPNARTHRPWPVIIFCALLLLGCGVTIGVWTQRLTSAEMLAGPHAYFLPAAPALP